MTVRILIVLPSDACSARLRVHHLLHVELDARLFIGIDVVGAKTGDTSGELKSPSERDEGIGAILWSTALPLPPTLPSAACFCASTSRSSMDVAFRINMLGPLLRLGASGSSETSKKVRLVATGLRVGNAPHSQEYSGAEVDMLGSGVDSCRSGGADSPRT